MATRSRRRSRPDETEAYDDEFGFVSDDDIVAFMAEQEIDEAKEEEKASGFWNLQTASGMGLIGLGALYSLQQLGVLAFGLDLSWFVQVMPIFAAVLIMLTGFGVLSWSPAARRRKKARKRAARLRRQQSSRRSRQRSPREEQAPRAEGRTVGRRPRGERTAEATSRAFEQAERAFRSASKTTSRALDEAKARRAKARRAGRTRLTKDRANKKISGVAAGMAHYFGLEPTVLRIAWVVAAIFTQGGALIPYIILSMVLDNEEDLDDDPLITISDD